MAIGEKPPYRNDTADDADGSNTSDPSDIDISPRLPNGSVLTSSSWLRNDDIAVSISARAESRDIPQAPRHAFGK